MPYYGSLRRRIAGSANRLRTLDNLIALRRQLALELPDKDSEHNLLLATWNIRDFGKRGSRRGYGSRLPESHHYIAEILSRFDLVAVQEVNDLEEWHVVMGLLGPHWDYIATDVTDTTLGGNGERLTFAYDRRKVRFRNIAGEIVLPSSLLISKATAKIEGKKFVAGKQFRRTPFVASFQSNWLKFDLCTVHIYYGESSGEALQERIEEIQRIASYLGRRADQELAQDRALLLLGDFNIVHPSHETMKALLDEGFRVPKPLQQPSNVKRTNYYDQIAFKTDDAVLNYVEKPASTPKNRNAGVLEVMASVFTTAQAETYLADAKKSPNGKSLSGAALETYYDDWRTYQMSDHNLMWVRIGTNDTDDYLARQRKLLAET